MIVGQSQDDMDDEEIFPIHVSEITYERLLRIRENSSYMKKDGHEYLIIMSLLQLSNTNPAFNYQIVYRRRAIHMNYSIEVPRTLYERLNKVLDTTGIRSHDELLWRLIENYIKLHR
jgi:hypothetical protein